MKYLNLRFLHIHLVPERCGGIQERHFAHHVNNSTFEPDLSWWKLSNISFILISYSSSYYYGGVEGTTTSSSTTTTTIIIYILLVFWAFYHMM